MALPSIAKQKPAHKPMVDANKTATKMLLHTSQRDHLTELASSSNKSSFHIDTSLRQQITHLDSLSPEPSSFGSPRMLPSNAKGFFFSDEKIDGAHVHMNSPLDKRKALDLNQIDGSQNKKLPAFEESMHTKRKLDVKNNKKGQKNDDIKPLKKNKLSPADIKPLKKNKLSPADIKPLEKNKLSPADIKPLEKNKLSPADIKPLEKKKVLPKVHKRLEASKKLITIRSADMVLALEDNKSLDKDKKMKKKKVIIEEQSPSEKKEVIIEEETSNQNTKDKMSADMNSSTIVQNDSLDIPADLNCEKSEEKSSFLIRVPQDLSNDTNSIPSEQKDMAALLSKAGYSLDVEHIETARSRRNARRPSVLMRALAKNISNPSPTENRSRSTSPPDVLVPSTNKSLLPSPGDSSEDSSIHDDSIPFLSPPTSPKPKKNAAPAVPLISIIPDVPLVDLSSKHAPESKVEAKKSLNPMSFLNLDHLKPSNDLPETPRDERDAPAELEAERKRQTQFRALDSWLNLQEDLEEKMGSMIRSEDSDSDSDSSDDEKPQTKMVTSPFKHTLDDLDIDLGAKKEWNSPKLDSKVGFALDFGKLHTLENKATDPRKKFAMTARLPSARVCEVRQRMNAVKQHVNNVDNININSFAHGKSLFNFQGRPVKLSAKERRKIKNIFISWLRWIKRVKARREHNKRHAEMIRGYVNTPIHNKMLKWYHRACFKGLERASELPLNINSKKVLMAQTERAKIEIPQALQASILAEAYNIVVSMLEQYVNAYGVDAPQTFSASKKLLDISTKLDNQLSPEIEAIVTRCFLNNNPGS